MATYVLIPGAGGASWYWHRVVPLLAAQGHAALAVDLPADDDTAGIAEYADAVVAAVTATRGHGGHAGGGGDRDHADLVVVAQSLGGFTAPLVCERLPVDLLVLVNAMIPLPGETAGAWWDNTGQAQARAELAASDGRSAEFDAMEDFLHDVPPDVIADSEAHQRDQSGAPFAQPWPLAAWPDVPTRVLVGRDDRFFPAAFQHRVARERLDVEPDEIPGGHLVALSRPHELAEHLERCRRELHEAAAAPGDVSARAF